MDTYRVIYTYRGGDEIAFEPMTRDEAMASFDLRLTQGRTVPWSGFERLRVMSDQEWQKVKNR